MPDELTDEQLAELQDPGAWDSANAIVVYPGADRRYYADVTIRLDADMLDLLQEATEQAGDWLPYYIRGAALEKARASAASAADSTTRRRA